MILCQRLNLSILLMESSYTRKERNFFHNLKFHYRFCNIHNSFYEVLKIILKTFLNLSENKLSNIIGIIRKNFLINEIITCEYKIMNDKSINFK